MTKPDNPPSIRLFKSFAHHPVNFRAMLAERTKTDDR